METKESKKVIEIEGVKLTEEALNEIFYLQNETRREYFEKGYNDKKRFNNEGANTEIQFLNDSIHYLIDLGKTDENMHPNLMQVFRCLNNYKILLDKLKSPE